MPGISSDYMVSLISESHNEACLKMGTRLNNMRLSVLGNVELILGASMEKFSWKCSKFFKKIYEKLELLSSPASYFVQMKKRKVPQAGNGKKYDCAILQWDSVGLETDIRNPLRTDASSEIP